MRHGSIDPVVSNENTSSTGPPGGGGASNLGCLAANGPASFVSSLSVSLDGAERFAPPVARPPPLPLTAGRILAEVGTTAAG